MTEAVNGNGTTESQKRFRKIIEKISTRENILDPEITYKSGQIKGDGYIGVVNAVDINGSNKKIGVIVKTTPDSLELRKQAPIGEAFSREIFVYDRILKEFEQLQKDIKHPFNSTPKCYGTISEECYETIILENLKDSDFSLWNRKEPMDKAHVQLVFKEYGRFHACSIAMKKQNPMLFEELTKDLDDVFLVRTPKDKMDELLEKNLADIKGFFDPHEDVELMEEYEEFAKKAYDYMLYCSKPTKNSVIVHGDCWCNNMMFKYGDNKNPRIPTSMKLIDFQISRHATPVIDLTYFACTCCPKAILSDYRSLLRTYYDSLAEHLRDLGCDAEELFPYEQLEKEWRLYSGYGVIIASFLIKLMLSDSDEAPDMAASVENDESYMDAFNFNIKNQSEYGRRITDVIRVFHDNNLFKSYSID